MGWIKARECENSACVELTVDGGLVAVRNSNVPGEMVWFDSEEWRAFTAGVKAGDFDHIDPGRVL